MVHRIKLFYLQNRISILVTIWSTILLTMLLLQVMLMTVSLKQSERNEEMIKGLVCIMLIVPEDRTKDNVAGCINENKAEPVPFEFNTIDTEDVPKVKPLESARYSELQAPVSTLAATSKRQEVTTSDPPEPPEPEAKKHQASPQPPVIAKETRTHSGKTETKHSGDTFWVSIVVE